MADAQLRDAEREATRRPDDATAGHAWLAAADRAGDRVQATRALGHLARLGDARGYDALLARVPWPYDAGPGATRFLRAPSVDGARALLAFDDRVQVRVQAGKGVVQVAGTQRAWETPATRWNRPFVWLTPAGVVSFEDEALRLRDAVTGEVAATARVPTSTPGHVTVEADRALVAVDGGGAVCVDLLGQPGAVVWDSRAPAAQPASRRGYDPGATYRPGDAVTHPKFGEGVVARVVDGRKVVIGFEDGERTLAHGARREVAPPPAVALTRPLRRVLLAASLALLEDDRRVTALDARTGAPLWASDGPAELRGADLRGVVLHQNADPKRRATVHSLVELEPRTGRERWFFPSSGVHYDALGAEVALTTRVTRKGWIDREAERELVAVERTTGQVRWRRPTQGLDVVWAVTLAHVLVRTYAETRAAVLDLATGADVPTPA